MSLVDSRPNVVIPPTSDMPHPSKGPPRTRNFDLEKLVILPPVHSYGDPYSPTGNKV
jgi:hypothetical protein